MDEKDHENLLIIIFIYYNEVSKRMKKPEIFKSVFELTVKDNPVYGTAAQTGAELLSKTNFYGIGVTIEKVDENVYSIVSRTHNAGYASKDFCFIAGILQDLGELTLQEIWGMVTFRRQEQWHVFDYPEFYKEFVLVSHE
jgi:hypothetical protein